MRDETKGTKTNRVMLNIAQCGNLEPPEPGIAPVVIDGIPIHAITALCLTAGIDQMTRLQIVFECEVGGQIGGADVKDMLRRAQEGED